MEKILRGSSILCILMATAFSITSFAQSKISPNEISAHAGEIASLCGKVYYASLLGNVTGKPTLLQLEGTNPKEKIEVRIQFEEFPNFNYNPEALFLNKNICLTGRITKDRDYAEMIIDKSNTSRLLNEAFAAPHDSSFQNIASSKKDGNTQPTSRIIRTFSNAYLLTGPRLNERIITWLKQGSSVLVDYTSRGWSYVRVIENVASPDNSEWMYGFVKNQALGLTKRRR